MRNCEWLDEGTQIMLENANAKDFFTRPVKLKLNSGAYISISHLLPAIEILRSHAGMELDDALITIGCSQSQSELVKDYYSSLI
ncbi:hypothetical protein [Aeromonas sp. JL9]|uniref:hypothetical protein n=1 Tax=Aeromonas sp. JL9 TaxID=2950549 RepID=UPI00210CFB23|nr:hypothetical protein [Aeromonas sp. JL9]MCQ4111515.1 hypothetical protein [Aeromonas sp. JL9]